MSVTRPMNNSNPNPNLVPRNGTLPKRIYMCMFHAASQMICKIYVIQPANFFKSCV